MQVDAFDYELPAELIAQSPLDRRSDARLLHLDRSSSSLTHLRVSNLPELLQPGDLLVVNDTRVFPARLLGRRVPSGGAVECLLISPISQSPAEQLWNALMHPGQKLKPGALVEFDGPRPIHGEVMERHFYGRRTIRLWTPDGSSVDDAIDQIGHVPLPPYVKRPDTRADRDAYQTMFATERGSVAAPTAGLHFTPSLVQQLHQREIEIAAITLHVGYGTFQPVRVESVEEHKLEAERYTVNEVAMQAINRALDERRRVIAVGTTTTRTLEAVALQNGGRIVEGRGSTDLFIYPEFQFQVVSGLLTNFHLPRSSLLMLVAALAGRERVLAAYRAAVAEQYRFYSYGDAMLVV